MKKLDANDVVVTATNPDGSAFELTSILEGTLLAWESSGAAPKRTSEPNRVLLHGGKEVQVTTVRKLKG